MIDKKTWVNRNACNFCDGNRLHSCTGISCKDAIRRSEKYFDEVIKHQDDEGEKERE